MNKTVPEALDWVRSLRKLLGPSKTEIVVIPSFPSLVPVAEALRGSEINLGAQDLSHLPPGAVTGEVSGSQLISAGCKYVLVGHSERRKLFCENNQLIYQKLKTALSEGLHPILCVGETLEEREDGKTRDQVGSQIKDGLAGLNPMEIRKVTIAYEPVWAIGTGKNATPGQAQEIHQFIRQQLAAQFGPELADEIRILYGGSVSPANSPNLLEQPDIDGALVGGASLDAESFCAIIKTVQ